MIFEKGLSSGTSSETITLRKSPLNEIQMTVEKHIEGEEITREKMPKEMRNRE